MKIPPRALYRTQVWCTIVAYVFYRITAYGSAFVNIAVMNLVLQNIPDVCSHHQHQGFTCPGATVFFTASVIWGVQIMCLSSLYAASWPSTRLFTRNDVFGYDLVLPYRGSASRDNLYMVEILSPALGAVFKHSTHSWRFVSCYTRIDL
jgi:OPT oligopeptide transporter protein